MDEGHLSPEDERRLLEAFEQASLHAYPNPQRIGCPGRLFLEQLARDRQSISVQDARLTHVARCSPCFQEFTKLRDAARRRPRQRVLAIAAGILVIALGLTAYLARDRFRTSSPALTYVAANLDLKNRSAVRGPGDAAVEPKPGSLRLPRGKLNLTVTLPIGSPAGQYEIQILQEIGHPLLTTSGTASIKQGLTLLPVHLDVAMLQPGRYLLGVRRVPWDWTFHPLVIE